jgi:2-oxoisovalerate dehydrogenase E1 component
VLRDIPGLVIASPAHPADAPSMLRTCVAAAVADGTVSVFLEPIARYHTRDLHVPGDEGWTAPYAAPDAWAHEHVPIGVPAIVRDGDDVLIVTWANGCFLAQRAAERLAADGIGCRILDVRWLAPLPLDEIVRHAVAVGRVLVVDEARRSGGPGEAIMAALAEAGFAGPARRLAGADSFVPLGDAARLVLVSEDDIESAVRALSVRPDRPLRGRVR